MQINQWHQFLQESSKNPFLFDNEKLLSFGNALEEIQASQDGTIICDLSHLGLLQLTGVDAANFLQGQVTNDVKKLDGHCAHYSAYCNPKGRVLALFLAFAHYDHLHLQLPKELIVSISKRLKMYVMRSKVEIEDVSETTIKIGLSGKNAGDLLISLFTTIPQAEYELISLDNGAVLRLPGLVPRYEIFANLENAKVIWNTLKPNALSVGAKCWEWLDIQAGIPEITLNTQEQFVPQMLNLDLLDAINFKKGCYTGQEIVARTHYLGKIKRRTYLAHLNASVQPEDGDDVSNETGEVIGKVVRSAFAPDNGYDLLAEIRLESVNTEKLFVKGSTLKIKPLPYSLEMIE